MVAHCDRQNIPEGVFERALGTILTSVDMPVILERTAELLQSQYGATRVGVTLIDREAPDQAEVVLVADADHPPEEPGTRVSLTGSARGEAVRSREPFVLEDIDPAGSRFPEEAEFGQLGYGSLVSFPLLVGDEVIGTLDIAHMPTCGLVCQCVRLAEKLALVIAISLHNSLLLQEVRDLNRALDRENAWLKGQLSAVQARRQYVAHSPLMQEVVRQVQRVAPSESSVLIRGETGTGKEGLARMVHDLGERSAAPFVVVNVGAIPENLIESELFGHEKGAFTGATRRRIGRFEQADGGTLFLDEIGDAPLPVQVKLLRALQEREIQRVGGTEPIGVDVRVVAATNRPLERMIEEGTFRSDLYYRLNIFPIHLPPLRQRRADIRPLVEHFVRKHSARMNRRPPQIPEEVVAVLEAHTWLGNVRELENFVERSLIFSPGETLVLPEVPGSPPVPTESLPTAVQPFDSAVRDLLQTALDAVDGRIYGPDGAADLLGLKPTTLQGKLRRHGLK